MGLRRVCRSDSSRVYVMLFVCFVSLSLCVCAMLCLCVSGVMLCLSVRVMCLCVSCVMLVRHACVCHVVIFQAHAHARTYAHVRR